jgi:hypothetical protein
MVASITLKVMPTGDANKECCIEVSLKQTKQVSQVTQSFKVSSISQLLTQSKMWGYNLRQYLTVRRDARFSAKKADQPPSSTPPSVALDYMSSLAYGRVQ